MTNNRRYRIGIDAFGIVLFALVMLPNIIWFAIPAPSDALRGDSAAPLLDGAAAVFQAAMVASSCAVVNIHREKPMKKAFLAGISAAVALYFAGWIFYYLGTVNVGVILILSAAPCIAFILLAIARKNIISLVTAVLFAVCHTISGIINFIF